MKKTLFKFYRHYKIHLLCWLIFIIYESLITSIVFYNWVNPVIYLSHYFIFITFFYMHANYALPWALHQKKWIYALVPSIVIAEAAGHMGFQYSVSYLLEYLEITKKPVTVDLNSILMNVYRSISFLLFSTGYFFLRTSLKERKKREEAEKESLQAIISRQEMEQQLARARHAFLKAQINPHFLFNTLDFIYHQVNVHSQEAGEAIVRLADMMRFAINADEMESSISLMDEIDQVENLLFLHSITKNGNRNIVFNYPPPVQRLYFIPLVLLTLVENILKHGNVNDPTQKASITLKIDGEFLLVETNNLIGDKTVNSGSTSGLANIHQRLSFAYGADATFKYGHHNHLFWTEIKVLVARLV